MKISNNVVTLTFNHVGGGLKIKDGMCSLIGFEISSDGTTFVPAKATITGTNTVDVSSSDVLNPIAVRFGWNRIPVGNLFNDMELPASPFNTETMPESIIKNITPSIVLPSVNLSTTINRGITIPTTVKMKSADGTLSDINVTWDKDAIDFSSANSGNFVVYGTANTADNNYYRAKAIVNVTNDNLSVSNLELKQVDNNKESDVPKVLSGVIRTKVTIAAKDSTKVALITALYDLKTNKIIKTSHTNYSLGANSNTTLKSDILVPDDRNNYYIKSYILGGFDNIIPLS